MSDDPVEQDWTWVEREFPTPASPGDSLDVDAITDAVWKALREFDRARRTARDLRIATRGGPTVKRGTGRAAQARFVAAAVVAVLAQEPTDE